MVETPRRSSTHLPQSQHPAGRSGVNYANLISGTHPSSALCVCALRFVTDPGGSSNAITSPWTGEPQDCSPIAAQQSQNEGEDNEPVRCASDILEHAQKDKSGNWSAEKDPERSLRGRKRKIKPSCPVMAHKGHITGGAQWGTVSLSEMRRWGPRLLGVNINMHIPMTKNTHISMPARESQFTAVRPFHYITHTVPPQLTIIELYCIKKHKLFAFPPTHNAISR